jgi:hypothetical protein
MKNEIDYLLFKYNKKPSKNWLAKIKYLTEIYK